MLYQLSKLETQDRARNAAPQPARHRGRALHVGLDFPEKHLQERFYSILPFVAKHGPGLMDTLYENINLDCPDHKVLVVN